MKSNLEIAVGIICLLLLFVVCYASGYLHASSNANQGCKEAYQRYSAGDLK